MEIIKGSSIKIVCTIYSYWSGDVATSTLANLTGGVVKFYVKGRDGDQDVNAIIVKTGTITDGPNGVAEIILLASDTNTLPYTKLVCEIVARDASGSYIRNGVQSLTLKSNVCKTLF